MNEENGACFDHNNAEKNPSSLVMDQHLLFLSNTHSLPFLLYACGSPTVKKVCNTPQ